MNEVVYTRHAIRQARRQGVTPAMLQTVWEYADIEMPLGSGRIAMRLSAQALYLLALDQGCTLMERAQSIVLILTDEVVMAVVRSHGLPSRRYDRRGR